jgi:transcriptional regulator with XRE-family HTH domain
VDHVGTLLRRWRTTRRLSQEALAAHAEVSQRHLSWLETGRARPSREMVLVLASALDVPLRDRNALLLAAGFAPAYRELDLDAPALAPARRALDHLLRSAEPYPALVMNRRWELVVGNGPFRALTTAVLGRSVAAGENLLALTLDPDGLGRVVVDRATLARTLLLRVHRDAVATGDPEQHALLARLEAIPGVPADWRHEAWRHTPPVAATVDVSVGGVALSLFTAVTSLGTATDVGLAELHLEHWFPADDATDAALRAAWPG